MSRSNHRKGSDFVVLETVQGELKAAALKSHLESQGIPVLLQYESASIIYGLTADGLGQATLLVPREFIAEARQIIEPKIGNEHKSNFGPLESRD